MNKNDFESLIVKSFNRIKTDKQKLGLIFIDSLKGRQAKFFVDDEYFFLDVLDIEKIKNETPDISSESLSNIIVNNILGKMKEISFKPFTDEEIKTGFEEIISKHEDSGYEIDNEKVLLFIGKNKFKIPRVVFNGMAKNYFSKNEVFLELEKLLTKDITT